jgi:zinc and cadmium transporter
LKHTTLINIDGIVVAGAYQVDVKLGIITTLAIILHEIQQEIGDFGVIVFGGMSEKKAILYNLLSGFTAIFGAVLSLLMSNHITWLSSSLIPFAFGNFLYIAGSDLVPELKDEKNPLRGAIQLFYMILGVLLLYSLRFLD